MSKSIKLLAMAGLMAVVAACDTSDTEEYVLVDPEPVSVEPVYAGKYK